MNIYDKIISYFSPKQALQNQLVRHQLQALDTPYHSGDTQKRALRSWFPFLYSPNQETAQKQTITARCRDAYRNQPLARAVVTRLDSGVIGTGLMLQAQVDFKTLGITEDEADELNDLIEREFFAYANSIDIDAEKTLNFYGLQSLVFISSLISGDCFVATPFIKRAGGLYGTTIQIIEGERVCNPNYQQNTDKLIDGIEFDEYGSPLYYYVLSHYPTEYGVPDKWQRLPVFNSIGRRRVFHIYCKERPTQARGISYLAPILDPLKQLNQYTDAELTAAVITSFLTVFIKSSNPMPFMSEPTNTQIDEQREVALGSGKVIELMPGEDISTVNPNRPNENYDNFIKSIYKQIGACLQIPIDELMLTYEASYSAARAVMLKAWKSYLIHRQRFATQFCQPFYELWFDELVATGRVKVKDYNNPFIRAAYTRAEWRGPARGAIDELDEIRAAQERINAGISTIQIEASELKGADWQKIHAQRAREHKKRIESGLIADIETVKEKTTTAIKRQAEPIQEGGENDKDVI